MRESFNQSKSLRVTAVIFIVILTCNVNVFSQYSDPYFINKNECSLIRSIGILPVEFDCYYLTAGGVREYNDSLSCLARLEISTKTEKILTDFGYRTVNFSENKEYHKSFKEIWIFFQVIDNLINNNIYGMEPFPAAKERFSYTLPPMEQLFSQLDIDAILLTTGFDDISTERRKKLKTGAAVGAVFSAILSGVITSVPDDKTIISSALVKKNGEIVWYNNISGSKNTDMSRKNDTDRLIGNLLSGIKKGIK